MMQTASDDEEENDAECLVDVSVVNGGGGEEITANQQQNSAEEDTTYNNVAAADDSSAALATTTRTAAVSTTTTATSNNTLTTTTHFPCIEQPQRVTLHNCGYYLWSYRNGKAVARKKRSSNDEFLLEYVLGQNIVKITNHKFGGVLSAIEDDKNPNNNGDRKICFVKPPKSTEKEEEANKKDNQKKKKSDSELKKNQSSGGEDEDDDDEEGFQDEPITNHQSQKINPEDQQWFFVKGNHNRIHLKSLATGQNLAIQKDSGNLTLVTDSIMKLHPYDKLNSPQSNITTSWDIECVTGELCFMSNNFLSSLDTRIRCDMAGLLTTTTTTKGWEVFRFMEASHGYVKISSWMHKQWLLCGQADGTVTTCSHADSFLEDDLDIEIEKQEEEKYNNNSKEGNNDDSATEFVKQTNKKKKKMKCSKWAIMKYIPPSSENGTHNNETTTTTNNNFGGGGAGVIIRNKTFGRLLCIKDGCILHTIDPNDPNDEKMNLEKQLKEAGYYEDDEDEDDSKIEAPSDRSGSTSSESLPTANNNLNKWWNNSTKSINTSMRKGMDNWSENSKNMSTSMRKNMNQWSKSWNKSMNTMIASANGTELPKQEEEQQQQEEAPPPPPVETIVWHIEAAHSQTYYFLNAPLSSSSSTTTTTTDDRNNNNNQEESKHDDESKEEEESKKNDPETAAEAIAPKSIGPYPNVTPNLRQTEKIQLIRKKDGTTKLNLIEKNQYISCTANGQIVLFDNNVFGTSSSARTAGGQNIDDESTDWIMDKHPKFPESGSTFRSKLYGYYLSYKAIEEEDEEGLSESAATAGKGAGEDEGGNHDAEETEAATEKADSSKEEQQQASTTSMNNSMMNLMLGKSSSSLGSSSRRNNKKSSEDGDNNNTLNNSMAMMNSMFGQKKEPIPTLVGVELVDELCVWNLQPCMPRAVSSEKIKTFALGTGIAVGTTIAMPFALAGVGAVLGAVGAEVGIVANAIAVGLTGAEALASVGAIGATAYIVFRPEENSLTDAPKVDDDDEDAKAEVEWSKRPLSNWREW